MSSARPTVEWNAGRPLRWHQALSWAITGLAAPHLGEQQQPDLDVLVALLGGRARGDDSGCGADRLEELRRRISARRSAGEPWPFPVPPDLLAGLGPAQFGAALAELRRRLRLDRAERPVLSARRPDADEQRLLRDVPPHHGV